MADGQVECILGVSLRALLPPVCNDAIDLCQEFELRELHQTIVTDYIVLCVLFSFAKDKLEVLECLVNTFFAEEALCVEILPLNQFIATEVGKSDPTFSARIGSYCCIVGTREGPFAETTVVVLIVVGRSHLIGPGKNRFRGCEKDIGASLTSHITAELRARVVVEELLHSFAFPELSSRRGCISHLSGY